MPRETKTGSKSSGTGALRGVFTFALTGVLLGAIGVGGWMGMQRMQARVGEYTRQPLSVVMEWPAMAKPAPAAGKGKAAAAKEPEVEDPGTWLSAQYQHELLAIAHASLSEDPFDHDALERTAQAMVATGWMKRIKSIRREAGGVVRIAGEWRTPAAVVRHGDRDHLVSADGELLPVNFPPGSTGFRVILNPAYPPPEQPGAKWLGGDVPAALSLMACLQRHKAYPQVGAIDASAYLRGRKLSIVTDKGNRVVWGVPPGETRVGEVSTAEKIKQLDRLLRDPAYGHRIDAGQAMVDVSNPKGILIDVSAQPVNPPSQVPVDDPPTEPVKAADRGSIAKGEDPSGE